MSYILEWLDYRLLGSGVLKFPDSAGKLGWQSGGISLNQPNSDGLQPNSKRKLLARALLITIASILTAMVSNLLAMASNLHKTLKQTL